MAHKTISCILIAALLCCALCACSVRDAVDEQTEILGTPIEETDEGLQQNEPELINSVLTLPYLQDATFDPLLCADGAQQYIASLLYEGLFVLDETFAPQNVLCESYVYDEESLTYRFFIREGVEFSDGTLLTAEDVLAAYRRASTSARYSARFSRVASMSAEDERTFVVKLSDPCALFTALLDIPIVKRGTEGDIVPLGTGPYLFVTDTGGASLLANSAWWRGETQPVECIRLVGTKSVDTLVYLFSACQTQLFACDLTGTDSFSATGSIDLFNFPTTVFQYLICNMNGPLSDPALRRAVSCGFDRTLLVAGNLSNHATVAEIPISPASPLYPGALAKSILRPNFEASLAECAAGIPEKPLVFIVNSENDFKVSAAEYIAHTLTTKGLAVEVRPLVWEEYVAALESGAFDLCYAEVKLTADWDFSPLVSANGALNYGGAASPVLDTLLAEFRKDPSEETANALYTFLVRQAPIVPICFKSYSLLAQSGTLQKASPTVSNLFYDFGNWEFSDIIVENGRQK
ncbi:MAG: ABC transporter substrate-binding protein [Oscillospiraceae bacterium]|nr:ABC transporter substrate-binding protein [Oscillospiraceae bacterium]